MKIILCHREQKNGKIVLEGQKKSLLSTERGKIVLGGSVSGGKWSVQKLP